MLNCLFVGLGGFIGSICRYLIGLIPLTAESGFPYKTFLINIAGAFVIGFIAALSVKNSQINARLILMLKVGVCGGFTTFSTFAYETSTLMKNGSTGIALLYVIASAVLGVIAVFVAEGIVK